VASVVDGTLHGYGQTAIAGVSNIGSDRNWSGSEFNQANWYAFGRLAWDHELTSGAVADEWLRRTFSNDTGFVAVARDMMLASWETYVSYTMPLGLNTMMSGNHYGPGPWVRRGGGEGTRANFHHADAVGIGFDRTRSGSDAVDQYFPPLNDIFDDIERTPDKFLLWFHHVPWDYEMDTGRTLWDELALRYQRGVEQVRQMQATWASLGGLIDEERFDEVSENLSIQEEEARWWRDACLLYFQQFSMRPLPGGVEPPAHTLEEYMQPDFRRPPDYQ
jgi:alpha-glucuronidase